MPGTVWPHDEAEPPAVNPKIRRSHRHIYQFCTSGRQDPHHTGIVLKTCSTPSTVKFTVFKSFCLTVKPQHSVNSSGGSMKIN